MYTLYYIAMRIAIMNTEHLSEMPQMQSILSDVCVTQNYELFSSYVT